MDKDKFYIELNHYGFYEVKNKPNEVELKEYYSEKYYQLGLGSYNLEYSDDEIVYIHNKIAEKFHVLSKLISINESTTILDVGCGEGWVLNYCKSKGIPVTGIDYSSFACKKFNPKVIENLIEGDIYDALSKLLQSNRKYHVIWLDNVLEHVINPLLLLKVCENLLEEDGVLMVEVPNDFSKLQNYLFDHNFINKQFWVALPDHLSYFNKDGLNNLASDANFKEVYSMSDFPIDVNLLNDRTNYINDKSLGKACYIAKVKFENFIHSNGIDNAINLYKSFIDAGIGRCISSFYMKA